MANRVSPGLYVNVYDFATYAPALGAATLCVLGGASKGPLNTPTLILDEGALVRTFGAPLLTDYGLQAAVQFLKRGQRLVYVRVANNAISADITVPGLDDGTAATKAAGTISLTGSVNPSDGDAVTIRDRVPTANLNNDAVGALGNVTITRVGAGISVTGLAGGTALVRASGSIKFIGGANPADGDTVTISDGTTAKTFEFDSNAAVTGTNVSVAIGADGYATMANLISAINAFAFNVSAVAGHTAVTFEFDSNDSVTSGSVAVLIGSSAAASLLNLISAINSSLACGATAANATVTVPALALTSKITGIDGNAPVAELSANIGVTGLTGAIDAVAGSVDTVLNVLAKNPGTWGNSIRVTITATTDIGAPAGNFDLSVTAPVDEAGTLAVVERYTNLSTDPLSARFAETVIADGIVGELSPSSFIVVDVLSNAGTVAVGTYSLGTGTGNVGTDGITGLTATHYVGTVSGQTATGLQAVKNPERVEFNLLAIPGVSHKDVIAEMIAVATYRNDALVLVDPPFGATRDQVVAWHNGTSQVFSNAPTAALDSRFAALYWSWTKVEDKYNKRMLYLPPSGAVAAACAHNDTVAGPQYPVAGHVRGMVDALGVEYSPDQLERDLLVGDQNRVNPIVDFAVGGCTIYGNRTLQRRRTALDNVHTQRMLLFAQKLIASAVKYLVFEPNDSVTWLKFNAMVNPVLENLKQGRGIEEFRVRCDESTNPAEQRQRKTMKGKIQIKPVEAAEIIEVDFALSATGAEFSEV